MVIVQLGPDKNFQLSKIPIIGDFNYQDSTVYKSNNPPYPPVKKKNPRTIFQSPKQSEIPGTFIIRPQSAQPAYFPRSRRPSNQPTPRKAETTAAPQLAPKERRRRHAAASLSLPV